MVHAAQFADDGRQRGRDDRLVEGGQEHAQQQRADGDENGSPVVPLTGGRPHLGAAHFLSHADLLGYVALFHPIVVCLSGYGLPRGAVWQVGRWVWHGTAA